MPARVSPTSAPAARRYCSRPGWPGEVLACPRQPDSRSRMPAFQEVSASVFSREEYHENFNIESNDPGCGFRGGHAGSGFRSRQASRVRRYGRSWRWHRHFRKNDPVDHWQVQFDEGASDCYQQRQCRRRRGLCLYGDGQGR
ncbi:hypothetical protein MESS2_p10006 [Mesorhizobium metallidurans STM 2683]|uniref:Uncharacterized protein n=1 Tax=Mesorhizobium metallidurans STM 2683 TaxID=1297569 RepID=M5FBX2_9HYPH|nr:hypothetical protein MESS2_p10006 [Mesorhizobium metallidurans STM 2683]